MTTSTFPEMRTAVIQDIIRLAREKYVYPELGDRIGSQLLAKLESGGYDDVAQENDLAFRLTTDLQSIGNDLHWCVIYDPKRIAVDEKERGDLAWTADTLLGDYTPVVLNEAQLSRCAGEYGKRRFLVQNGALLYGNTAYPETFPLVPLAENRFRLDDDCKFEFVLAQDDRAAAVKIFYRDGRPEAFASRTE